MLHGREGGEAGSGGALIKLFILIWDWGFGICFPLRCSRRGRMDERKEWMEMIHLEIGFGWCGYVHAASETTLKKLITVA